MENQQPEQPVEENEQGAHPLFVVMRGKIKVHIDPSNPESHVIFGRLGYEDAAEAMESLVALVLEFQNYGKAVALTYFEDSMFRDVIENVIGPLMGFPKGRKELYKIIARLLTWGETGAQVTPEDVANKELFPLPSIPILLDAFVCHPDLENFLSESRRALKHLTTLNPQVSVWWKKVSTALAGAPGPSQTEPGGEKLSTSSGDDTPPSN